MSPKFRDRNLECLREERPSRSLRAEVEAAELKAAAAAGCGERLPALGRREALTRSEQTLEGAVELCSVRPVTICSRSSGSLSHVQTHECSVCF